MIHDQVDYWRQLRQAGAQKMPALQQIPGCRHTLILAPCLCLPTLNMLCSVFVSLLLIVAIVCPVSCVLGTACTIAESWFLRRVCRYACAEWRWLSCVRTLEPYESDDLLGLRIANIRYLVRTSVQRHYWNAAHEACIDSIAIFGKAWKCCLCMLWVLVDGFVSAIIMLFLGKQSLLFACGSISIMYCSLFTGFTGVEFRRNQVCDIVHLN